MRSPLAGDALEPPESEDLRIVVKGPLTDADAKKVATYARKYRRCKIVPGMPYRSQPFSLAFLRHFPFLYGFDMPRDFDDPEAIGLLPAGLRALDVGPSSKLSLKFLERFGELRELYLEGTSRNIEVLSRLTRIEELTLRSITLPDLGLLLPMAGLTSLDLKLGGTRDLRQLPRFRCLRHLEIWMVKGFKDTEFIGDLANLQSLFLQSLKGVTRLPSLRMLKKLRRVELEQMSGLKDLSPVAEAPALQELVVSAARHMSPGDFRPFLGHPKLKRASIGLGSAKKNAEVEKLLGLEAAD